MSKKYDNFGSLVKVGFVEVYAYTGAACWTASDCVASDTGGPRPPGWWKCYTGPDIPSAPYHYSHPTSPPSHCHDPYWS